MIETLSKNRLGKYAMLRLKKHRDELRLFIVEGEKSVSELVSTFTPIALIGNQQWFASGNRDALLQQFQEVWQASPDKMRRLTSMATPPAVLAVFEMPQPQLYQPDTGALYIVLDGVQDPGNLGTIIRTADWFGIHTIYASHNTVDVYNAKTIQATMGSLARVNVVYTDLPRLITDNDSMPVYGTLLDGDDIYTTQLTTNGFIIMGNEGNGISEQLRQCVTHKLLLPPYPIGNEHAESLNVGVATALVVAEFRRRTAILSSYSN